VQSQIPEQFERSVIGVGYDKYTSGIFYETNGYILYDKNQPKPKDIIYHSSGVKGRHLPKVCDKALDIVIRGVFSHDDVMGLLQLVKRMITTACGLEDFLMTVKMSKEPDAYDSSNQYGNMVQKAKSCGINIRWGDEFQYLKTVEYGYMLLGALANKSYRIDYDYYIERIASVLERPLKITHNLSEKQITYALKGYKVTPQKPTKQTKLRRINGIGHIDHKNLMIYGS
jgi:DNA polymerase elongation subunit (family B)